jgi:hypothetical protein
LSKHPVRVRADMQPGMNHARNIPELTNGLDRAYLDFVIHILSCITSSDPKSEAIERLLWLRHYLPKTCELMGIDKDLIP